MRTIIAVIALAAVTIATPATAQTIGYADAITTLARSCGSDINRYCKNASLADWGIGTCLDQNRANISAQCASDLVAVRRSLDAREAAQADAMQVCRRDAAQLCQYVQPGRGHILNCLLKAERSVSRRCNAAITNAGWR
jgi:hypothetical protein